uniref:Uncharacterized protein n=1 Tax=Rhizophora mucronata TaxID=61149 RepID=A0A2P2NUY3_RHIMU
MSCQNQNRPIPLILNKQISQALLICFCRLCLSFWI